MPQSIPLFQAVEDRKPWAQCYPPVPEDFVWEDFVNFVPLIAVVMSIVVAFVTIFGRKNRSWFDRFILGYLFLSVIIHFGLSQPIFI